MARILLRGPRVVLRDFESEDVDDVHAFAGDPEVTRFTDWGPNTPERTAAFLDEAASTIAVEPRLRFPLAIVVTDGDGRAAVIGSCEVRIADGAPSTAALGYVVRRDRWGHGYATEAAGLLLRFAFERLGVTRVEATCSPENAASARVLEKAGFRREGLVRRAVRIKGVWRDSLIFGADAPGHS